MNIMKVINLLNKKANRNIPKRVINLDHIATECLNEEIEIIEDTPKEDKKIEKLIPYTDGLIATQNKINEIIDKINGEDNE